VKYGKQYGEKVRENNTGKKYGKKVREQNSGKQSRDFRTGPHPVTSGQACARYHFWLLPIAPPQILICPYPYTTHQSLIQSMIQQLS
jgi:hypothetical protein